MRIAGDDRRAGRVDVVEFEDGGSSRAAAETMALGSIAGR
jgi:hypothetical protein